jgi:hypothetical protein
VRDCATEVPPDYEAPNFQTRALQHTSVKLTWDGDDDARRRTLRKKMTQDAIREDDFRVGRGPQMQMGSGPCSFVFCCACARGESEGRRGRCLPRCMEKGLGIRV